jgi:restriction system protein
LIADELSEEGVLCVDRNPDSLWNPAVPVEITPTEFENVVLDWLRRAAAMEKQTIDARHLAVVDGTGGEYKIDVLVTFSRFAGARFIVLVECKHQRRPIEREDVMVLDAKIRDVGAHKGMLFSTSGFQSGAIEYAEAHGLATVTVVNGTWLYETRGASSGPVEPPPWVHFDAFVGIRMSKTPSGISCHTVEASRLNAIAEWLREEGSKTAPSD